MLNMRTKAKWSMGLMARKRKCLFIRERKTQNNLIMLKEWAYAITFLVAKASRSVCVI